MLHLQTQKNGVMLEPFADEHYVVSAQFRTVRTNIAFAGAALAQCLLVMLLSSAMSVRKSLVSANVAVLWAQAGKCVLQLDAALRRPTDYATFRTLNLAGVTTVLTGMQCPEAVVVQTFVDNKRIITSGPDSPNPSELLNSCRMAGLLEWAREC